METLKAKKKNGQMDFLLYVTVLLLCAFGLVMVFSASYYYAQNKASLNYDGLYYLKNQAKYMAMGLGVMIVMSRVDYHYLEKLRNVGLMVTLLLMLATVFWGEDINGAKRWLNLFDVITFQPSELAKFVLILYMASFMTRRTPQMKSFTRGIVPMLIIMCIICILLLLQKNMSMMMVVMMIGFVMLFLGGADMRHLVGLCLLAVPVFFLAASMETYRWNRLVIFTNPWKDPQGNGYQLIQSLYALGSGGLFGKGLNFSTQKLLFLTYGESDFIFAIIGEELGFIGCVLVIAAYFFLVCRGMRIAARCKDKFGSLLAAGITSVIAIQVAVNIGVATSSVPPTGQTLPFISAGGTSLTIFMAAAGILLNISRNTESI